MGSAKGEEGHHTDESPQHRVRISEPFAAMETEVTRLGQRLAVLNCHSRPFPALACSVRKIFMSRLPGE